MKPALFIGGPIDGRREVVRDGIYRVAEEMEGVKVLSLPDMDKLPSIIIHEYRAESIGADNKVVATVMVHEKLTCSDALEMLVNRYPAC